MTKGKTFCVGDIHGNNKGLLECLEKSGFNNETDTLIQLGDIADGWGETSECVDTLLGIKNLISIRGNHDIWVYDWFKWGSRPVMWTTQGGQATVDSYIKSGKFCERFHKDFWNNQKDWYIDDENRLFIHAGWDYSMGFPAGAQCRLPLDVGTIARECHWDRSLLAGAKSGAVKNRQGKPTGFKALDEFKEIFIGHTATSSHLPENYLNLWNLDSGSGWHGKLTIMNVNTKEYWQSDYSRNLYPDEKGRG